MAGIGHNSDGAQADVLNSTAQTQLRTIVERVERLEEDKAAVMADQKEVYSEAKGNGFDVKVIRKIVRMRKMDRAKRLEEEAITDLYLSALDELSEPFDAVKDAVHGPDDDDEEDDSEFA